jgi:MFS family permease
VSVSLSVYVDLLSKNPNYRNLWLARVVSNFGDWFNLLASAALITSLTGAGTAVSYLFLARFLPVFVMSPLAGVLADRYERRLVMMLTDVLRSVAVLGFLFVRSADDIWLLYTLTVVQFVFSALYTPAHTALLSNIVDPDDLVTANALDGFTWSTMLALGALFGGLAAATLGIPAAFVIDAATYLVSAWFVMRVSGAVLPVQGAVSKVRLFDILDGLRYLRGRPFILGLSLVKAGGALVWGAINVLEIPLAQQIFAVGSGGTITLGIIYAATGVGTGVGPLLIRQRVGDGREASLRAITLGFVLLAAGVSLIGIAPNLAWVIGATVLRSVGTGALWVFSSAILMQVTEDRLRGRVFAFEYAALTLTQSISTVMAGITVDYWQLGVQEALLLMGVLGAATTGVWLVFLRRSAMQPAAAA